MEIKYKKISFVIFSLLVLNIIGAVKAQEQSDSLVNIAFGTVAKKDLLGGISTVNVSELLEKKYSANALDGIQGLVGGYTGNIWGQAGLVLVDGIPRNASDIRASEVETVTILKGANAVALYGSKGVKGVILITTKRGIASPLKIDVRLNTGIYVPKRFPKYLHSADYMTLYNEALRNDGSAEKYSQSDIYNTETNVNPYRYPDIDFYNSTYLRKAYNKSDATVEVYGGNSRARYYTNLGMTYNNSLVKYGEQGKNNDTRFNVRSNIDVDINDWLKASADAAVIISDNYAGRGDFWGASSTLRPNWFTPLLPTSMMDPNNSTIQAYIKNSDHLVGGQYLYGGTASTLTNNFADMLAGGYIKTKNRSFMFDINLNADLKAIVKGLSFKTGYSVDYTDLYSEAYNLAYAVYEPIWSTMNGKDMITGLNKYNDDTNTASEFVGSSSYTQTMQFNAQFDYKRTFAQHHNVSASLIGWGYQIQDSNDADHSGSDSHRISNLNLGFQANYNYQNRYYFDFSAAEVHSAQLPSKNRNAFSPTVTLGWRISDEPFFKEHIPFVNNLKLNTSYANLHQDMDITATISSVVTNYYLYQGYYNFKGGWYQWHDNTAGGWTVNSRRGNNPNLTYVTRNEFRIGLEASLLNNLLNLDANYFIQDTNGGLTQGSSTIYPAYYNNSDFSFLPYLNYNKDRRKGFDFTLNVNKKIGVVYATLGLAGMYFSSEAVRRDEVYQDAYQYRAGKPMDSYWGYVSEGFFQDANDIVNHAKQSWGTVMPGDIKYVDQNKDGVIDSKDQVNLGHNGWSVSPFTYGINLTLKWNRFTFFGLGTGSSGAIGFKNNSYYWVKGASKYSDVVLGRWTEATKNTATYPRLTATDNSNNFQNSTFWMYKTNRFDLSRIQLTYDFNNELFKKSFVHGLSVYVSGESLLTISKERKMMETNVGSAPQNRFYNLGIKAAF